MLFDTSPDPAAGRPARARVDPAPAPELGPSCWPTRCSSAPRCRPRSCAASGRRCAARGPSPRGSVRALGSVGALAWTGLQAAPPSPFNVRIGPHRRFTWVRADLDQFKAIKNSLGGTVNDVVLAVGDRRARQLHAPPRRADRARRAQGDGPGLGPRRRRARGAGQPRRRDVGDAPGGTDRSGAAPAQDQRGDGRPSSSPGQAVGAEILTAAVGLRAADDHGAGGAAPGAPAAVQPCRHQRPRSAVPALPARPRARVDLSDGPAGREHRARDRDPQLQRAAELRAGGRLRRARRRRGARGRAALRDRGARGDRGAHPAPDRTAPRRARRPAGRAPRGDAERLASRRRGPAESRSRLLRVLERVAIVARVAGAVDRADPAAVRVLRRPRPGRRSQARTPARGRRSADLGHGALLPGQPRPAYNSSPPTSGSARPRGRDGATTPRSTTTSCCRRSSRETS